MARLLRIRRAEIDRALWMAGLAVVLGWAMYTAFNATQAVFLVRSGAHSYPLFFILLALSVWPMVALQGLLTRRVGTARALRFNLVLNAFAGVAVYVLYRSAESVPGVAFAAYVVYSVAFELVMLLFWSFVTQHFNLLEGKRVYPLITAGSSVGYILAGVTTGAIASGWPSGGTEALTLVWAVGAAASALIARRVEVNLYRPHVEDDADHFDVDTRRRHDTRRFQALRESLRYVRRSRLMLAMVTAALLLVVAMRISDYLVAVAFVGATGGDLSALTTLIGNAWLVSYAVQLGLGLVVAPVLFGKLGVKNVMLALPLATLLGFAAVAMVPGLGAALFLFIIRNGLQTGVDDPAQNVLNNALPEQVAPRLKLVLDDLALPGAAVLAGALLLVVQALVPPSRLVLVLALVGIPTCVMFLAGAAWVRSQYVSAIYERLRAHALTLSDIEQALGRPSAAQVEELGTFLADGDERVRHFAAAALGRLVPEVFGELVPSLAVSEDAFLRRLAYQLAPPGAVDHALVERAAGADPDPDPWVVAAAAVAGYRLRPPWPGAIRVLGGLARGREPERRAAAIWAASFVVDEKVIVAGLGDRSPRVRLEAIRSFAKMKANVRGAADPLIHCMTDRDLEVRREALQQAIRWAPPGSDLDEFADALLAGLTRGDRHTRRLAAEALSVQAPQALERAIPLLLEGETETAVATIEALVRSGRPDLLRRAQEHLESLMDSALDAGEAAARLRAHDRVSGSPGLAHAFLGLALEGHADHAVEVGLGAMRALHGKRGFATIERGVSSRSEAARAEALETLLNFGPAWLAEPLARLADGGTFADAPPRLPSADELQRLDAHADHRVREAVRAVRTGRVSDHVKDLVALKKVPLFAGLTLEQLSSIDRMMVTRRYLRGERLFSAGDTGTELCVVLEGEVRIHHDRPGKEVTLARLGPSTAFGEMALFEEQPRSANAEAAVDSTVRVLRKDRFHAIVHEHPEVLFEVIKYLSQRLRDANVQLQGALEARPPAAPAEPVSA